MSKLPEFIYSTDEDGLWLNLCAASKPTWSQGVGSVTVPQTTSIPSAAAVSMTVNCTEPTTMAIHIRVPSWATGNRDIMVNGERAVMGNRVGDRGCRLTLVRYMVTRAWIGSSSQHIRNVGWQNDGSDVLVSSPLVKEPKFLRYDYVDVSRYSLWSKAGHRGSV